MKRLTSGSWQAATMDGASPSTGSRTRMITIGEFGAKNRRRHGTTLPHRTRRRSTKVVRVLWGYPTGAEVDRPDCRWLGHRLIVGCWRFGAHRGLASFPTVPGPARRASGPNRRQPGCAGPGSPPALVGSRASPNPAQLTPRAAPTSAGRGSRPIALRQALCVTRTPSTGPPITSPAGAGDTHP